MSKPDKKLIKNIIKRANEVDRRLKTALDAEKAEVANLRRSADTFLNEKIQETLNNMDVDMLSQGKQKIRVSYLHSAGINTVGQLAKLNRHQIEAIDGIGAQGAAKIYDLTRQIVQNTRAKLSLRINVDSPTKADELLVRALYCVICHEQQRKELKRIYDENHKALIKEVNSSKKAKSGFSWFFASKKRT